VYVIKLCPLFRACVLPTALSDVLSDYHMFKLTLTLLFAGIPGNISV